MTRCPAPRRAGRDSVNSSVVVVQRRVGLRGGAPLLGAYALAMCVESLTLALLALSLQRHRHRSRCRPPPRYKPPSLAWALPLSSCFLPDHFVSLYYFATSIEQCNVPHEIGQYSKNRFASTCPTPVGSYDVIA
ncbi:hypothetical protein EVAR_79979_1 [Eumeta japonica]|uniref:Uncharacterized protein n=1 Tax=Eumeta variegata TaxID=151549 RepID=A0A4C2AA14_EUMVA|nr:hypothetical protein EVAR_79979_1 [Eumeta japonica]